MSNRPFLLPGVVWAIASVSGFAVLTGLLLPWYAGTIIPRSGAPILHVERGWGSPHGWIVGAATVAALACGLIGWFRSRGRPGLGATALALVLVAVACATAWVYGSENADPIIRDGKRADAGLGVGLYVSLLASGAMALTLAIGMAIDLVRRKDTGVSRASDAG